MATKYSQALDEVKRLHRYKSGSPSVGSALGEEMVGFFKQSVAKRQTRLVKIAEAWEIIVPQMLTDHSALESLTRGVLTVIVDSSAHLYELKQLLLAGIEQQLLLACKSAGLKKIVLKPGRWYDGQGNADDRKVRFSHRLEKGPIVNGRARLSSSISRRPART